jgi:hypothetical protein
MDEFTREMHDTMVLSDALKLENKVIAALHALSMPTRVKRLGRAAILAQYGVTEQDIINYKLS